MAQEDIRELLAQLTDPERTTRARRILKLLKQPGVPSPDTWAFHLPKCFDAALDIAYTHSIYKEDGHKRVRWHWTQGSRFAFDDGDMIYTSAAGYTSAEPSRMTYLQVLRARPAIPASSGRSRIAGTVEARGTFANGTLIRCTQDDFVKLLIFGDITLRTRDELERIASAGQDLESTDDQ